MTQSLPVLDRNRLCIAYVVTSQYTFYGTLVHYTLKEALLVNIASVDSLLNGALVDQPVHICLTLLTISEDPSNGL